MIVNSNMMILDFVVIVILFRFRAFLLSKASRADVRAGPRGVRPCVVHPRACAVGTAG